MVEIIIFWDHLVAIVTTDFPLRSQNVLAFPEPGSLPAPTDTSVLGQLMEHDEPAAVRAALGPRPAVVLVGLQLAEVHGQLAELALHGLLQVLVGSLQALLGLLVLLEMVCHLHPRDGLLALRAEFQEPQAVGLMEGEMGRSHTSFAAGIGERELRAHRHGIQRGVGLHT